MDPKALAEGCRITADAAGGALGWVADPRNARTLAAERPAIESRLRRVAAEAGRLERSVGRPNCVGVFGPSQAGKSYLISILARRGVEPLIATFAGDRSEIDFIRDINPAGGDESTGVVTRFTIRPQTAPAGYPVCLRILGQVDVIKILVNSFFQDGDQENETAPAPAALEQHLASFEARKATAPVDALTEAEVWDIQDYVGRHAGGAATAAAIEPFWGRISALAPLLRIADRAAFLSILWGGHATYTAIYRRLAAALATLGFCEDAFCTLDALMPSRDSIINVNALAGLDDEAAPRLDIAVGAGAVVSLPRPVITALIAELRIICRDRPLPFFDHTDLLDFPGYRSRFRTDLKRLFRDAAQTAPREVFLRGKVDYLFQRYTAELELTAMVLCIPDSTLEVTSLPKAVENWIAATHGGTPEKRIRKPNLLFFAMTKFDRTLERKGGGDEGNLAEKFEIRFGASLGPFSKIEPSWVRQWRPGEPFRNLFLIRNPNVHFMGVVDYEGARETGIIPTQVSRLEALRRAFADLPTAQRHFVDPGAAWDALMTLNDGGAGFLAAALGDVCGPELKRRQVAARLGEIRADASALLSPYHVSDDAQNRRIERLAVVDEVIFPDVENAVVQGTFGTALRGLMIDASDLYVALAEALNRPGAEAEGRVVPPPKATGIFRKAAAPAPPPRPDRWARLAVAALGAWATQLHQRAEDERFARRVGMTGRCLREIVAELGAGARRTGLADHMAADFKRREAASQQNDAIARRAALVAERVINRFVAELGFDRIAAAEQVGLFGGDLEEPVFAARPVVYDASGLGVDDLDFTTQFVRQWGYALRAGASANAMSKAGSIEDALQNARLGEILRSLGP